MLHKERFKGRKTVILSFLLLIPTIAYTQDKITDAVIKAVMEAQAKYNVGNYHQPSFEERTTSFLMSNPSLIIPKCLNDPETKNVVLSNQTLRGLLTNQLKTSEKILDCLADPHMKRIIFSNEQVKKNAIERLWFLREKILDLAKDKNIRELIMSDSFLREFYESKQKEQDMKEHPEKVIEYFNNDPKMEQVILNDPSFRQELVQQQINYVNEEKWREQQRIEKRKKEADRIERERKDEDKRLKEEREQAKEQVIANKREQQADNQIQEEVIQLLPLIQLPDVGAPLITLQSDNQIQDELIPIMPASIQEQKTTTLLDMDEKGELFEDPTIWQAKLNNTIYHTKENLEKSWDKTKKVAKETPKVARQKVKGKFKSIPIKIDGQIAEAAFPGEGTSLVGRVHAFEDQKKDELKATNKILQCVVNAVANSDIQETEDCFSQAKNELWDNAKNRLAEVLPTPGWVRKVVKWVKVSDKKNSQDE